MTHTRPTPLTMFGTARISLRAGLAGLGVVVLCAMFASPAAYALPVPRSLVTIGQDNVKLGDVFEGLSAHQDFVLAPAPQPGQEVVWNKPTLQRIATAFNLPWRPQDNDVVRIRRAGITVDADTLKATLRDSLISGGYGDNFTIVLRSPLDMEPLVLPEDGSGTLSVTNLTYSPATGFFTAELMIAGLQKAASGVPETRIIRGEAKALVNVPALNRTIRAGETIAASDLIWITEEQRTLRGGKAGVAMRADDLIGKAARKTLTAQTAIKFDDIQSPLLVKRGDLVTIALENSAMQLTARGRAMSDGAHGEVIKVSNIASNRVIEARVSGDKQVSVSQ